MWQTALTVELFFAKTSKSPTPENFLTILGRVLYSNEKTRKIPQTEYLTHAVNFANIRYSRPVMVNIAQYVFATNVFVAEKFLLFRLMRRITQSMKRRKLSGSIERWQSFARIEAENAFSKHGYFIFWEDFTRKRTNHRTVVRSCQSKRNSSILVDAYEVQVVFK